MFDSSSEVENQNKYVGVKNMVRYFLLWIITISEVILFSCFPHIVNLACKAVLVAITNLKYAEDLAKGYKNYEPAYANSKDCIATVRSLINAVIF